jgi:hypothetical protein
MQREVNPPPIMYSGKFPAIHAGVVQAIRLIQGFSTLSLPEAFGFLFESSLFAVPHVNEKVDHFRIAGSRRLPNSELSIVKADIA